jgi:hypothetical protein
MTSKTPQIWNLEKMQIFFGGRTEIDLVTVRMFFATTDYVRNFSIRQPHGNASLRSPFAP